MANYYGTIRTNYFSVTDPERMREIICKVVGAEAVVELFTEEFKDGTKYGFGCYSTINGYEVADDEGESGYDYDAFIHDLQEVLAPGDAIVITEIGNEKLRYLFAGSLIITKETTKYITHYDTVGEELCELMGDDGFTTTFDY